MDRGSTRIAWQGISVTVPQDWAFAGLGGDWRKGSYRVAAPLDTFVEVEWSQASGSPNLKREFDASIQRLRQKSRRSSAPIEVKEKPGALSGLRLGGGVPHTFSLRSDSLAYGALWHCPESGRLLLAKVVGPSSESLGPLARSVLGTVVDWSHEEWVPWSVYGFSFRAPRTMRLQKPELKSGHIALEFVKVRSSRAGLLPIPIPGLRLADLEVEDRRRTLTVQRWGLANVALRRDEFQSWIGGALFRRLKAYDYKRLAAEWGEHEAAEVQGRRAGVRALLKRLPALLLRRDPVDSLVGHAWVCRASNRIFAVTASGARDEARDLASQVAATIECHDS